MSDWPKVKLSDVAEIVPGFAFKSKHFGENGVNVIKIKDINPPRIDVENSQKVDLSSYPIKRLQKYFLRKGDFVVAMTGATIGKIGKLTMDVEAIINQRVAKIFPKEGVVNEFVYYSVTNEGFDYFIQNNIDSHSAQENISGTSIGRYPILLPSPIEQERITAVLSSLDDKINLLHRQNKTLEALAQILFRHWFIDEDYESTITDVVQIQNGYAFKSKDFQETGLNSILKIKNISGGIVDIDNSDYVRRELALTTDSKFRIVGGDILFGMTGAKIGKMGIVPKTNKSLWLNQRVALLNSKSKGSKYLAYLQLASDFGQDHIKNTATGSAQPNISATGIESCGFPKLTEQQIVEYSNVLSPIYEKMIFNLGQVRTLRKLRDTLLPKLMSGKVRVRLDQS